MPFVIKINKKLQLPESAFRLLVEPGSFNDKDPIEVLCLDSALYNHNPFEDFTRLREIQLEKGITPAVIVQNLHTIEFNFLSANDYSEKERICLQYIKLKEKGSYGIPIIERFYLENNNRIDSQI